MGLKGIVVFWPPMLDPVTGALTSMAKCNLDILGLLGARLPSSFRLPAKYGVQVWAKGGPSYTSVAVLWKSRTGRYVEILREFSDGRMVWLRVFTSSHVLHYLPPVNSKEHEAKFANVMSAIDATVHCSATQQTPRMGRSLSVAVRLSGDQPSIFNPI